MNEDEARVLGYCPAKPLPNGEWLGIQPMLYTVGLFIFSESSWRTRYCYEHAIDAVAAFLVWDGQGDPPFNWIKQKPEDRINPRWLAAAKEELAK